MNDQINIKTVRVDIQENGIIRNLKGRFLAKLEKDSPQFADFTHDPEEPGRTDQEIVDETNELAAVFARLEGWGKEGADKPTFHDHAHPRSRKWWRMACEAQELLTHTDPNDAVSNLEE